MRSFLSILILSITCTISAQNHYFGMKGGVNFSNIHSNFMKKTNPNTGYIGALAYEYLINDNYSFGVGLSYGERGYTNRVIFTDENGISTNQEYKIEHVFNYISLPIKGGFSIGEEFSGFANIGLVPSYLIRAQSYIPALKQFGETKDITKDITENYSEFNLDGIIEIGAAYKLGDRFVTFLTFGYHNGLNNIIDIKDSENNMYHRGMSFSFGIKYALKSD